jgi:hypothetical protein
MKINVHEKVFIFNGPLLDDFPDAVDGWMFSLTWVQVISI